MEYKIKKLSDMNKGVRVDIENALYDVMVDIKDGRELSKELIKDDVFKKLYPLHSIDEKISKLDKTMIVGKILQDYVSKMEQLKK